MHDDAARPHGAVTSFVPARHEDAAAMQALARTAYAIYVERMGREPAPMTADYQAIAASGQALLAWRHDVLQAMLVTTLEGSALLIDNIAVAPAAQGSGLGSALLAEAARLAQEAGADELRLYTNEAMTENLEFYARRGFTETHRAVESGYRRVFFSRPIAPPLRV